MKVSLVQMAPLWLDVESNLQLLNQLINEYKEVDLIILPEMFSTGFVTAQQLAETKQDQIVGRMKEWARTLHAAIVGSLVYIENSNTYNRLLWVCPNGKTYTYDKRHLFALGEENAYFTAGDKRLIIDYEGVRFCPMICYDLRFPVWSRNADDYDVLIYVANWPEVRMYAWNTLLAARAIENQCYVVGVNRVGQDGQGLSYVGGSRVIGPNGECVMNMEATENVTQAISIDLDLLARFRKRFPFLRDRDRFILK